MTRRQVLHLKERFLEAFRRHGNVSWACQEAGVASRASVYQWQEHDDQFAAAFREAEVEATEVLEREMHRRAVEGVRRLKFDKDGEALIDPETGQLYTEMHYSDTLLIVALKARAPDKYRERLDVRRTDQPVVTGIPSDLLEAL